jgi:enterochelin esterase-like enzyme
MLGAVVSDPNASARAPICDAGSADNSTAVCVLSLQPSSAAQRAGFRPGDLIRRFGTTDVGTPDDLISAVAAAKVGDRVTVIVERNGQRAELQVEFSTSDVRRPPSGTAGATPVRPVVDWCRPPTDEELGRGRWRPPYERLPVPADPAEILALVRDTDTAVAIDGDVLSIVRRDASNALDVTGTFQCPMSRISGSDVWALQLRAASWEAAFFGYAFRSQPATPFSGFRYFRGPKAPALPAEKTTLAGRLIETSIASRHLGENRAITVYLPPRVAEANVPALFMADGESVWQYARVLEPLIDAGAIKPIAIVGVHSGQGERRAREYIAGVDAEAFAKHLAFFVDELLPWATSEYGISRERRDRALFGYSNGADFVAAAAVNHPELFAHVLPFSTGMRIQGPRPDAVDLPRFYFAAGELEPFITSTRAAHEAVQSWGAASSFDVYRSGHDALLWSVALVDIAPRVFPAAR